MMNLMGRVSCKTKTGVDILAHFEMVNFMDMVNLNGLMAPSTEETTLMASAKATDNSLTLKIQAYRRASGRRAF